MTTVRVFNKCLHVLMRKDAGRCEAATNSHFHPTDSTKFVTCGGDKKVNVWRLDDSKKLGLEKLATLDAHDAPVNVAKWSYSGRYLATSGDDAVIIVWEFDPENKQKMVRHFGAAAHDDKLKEQGFWRQKCTLRNGALGAEVSDLAWDPQDKYIVACSPHGKAIVFHVNDSREMDRIPANMKTAGTFFQGIGWSPDGKYIAIQTMDKHVRLYVRRRCKSLKFKPLIGQDGKLNSIIDGKGKKQRLFSGSLVGQFKRPAFSPDGQFLLAVAGVVRKPDDEKEEDAEREKEKENEDGKKKQYKKRGAPDPAAHLIRLRNPKAQITSYGVKNNKKGTLGITACCFCPRVYKLQGKPEPGSPSDRYNMDYRCLFALLARTNIYVYDTAHNNPLFWWQDVDIQEFLSLTWSSDGLSLIATDCEGFATQVRFNSHDLGEVYDMGPLEMAQDVSLKNSKKTSPNSKGSANGVVTLVPTKKKTKKKAADKSIQKISSLFKPLPTLAPSHNGKPRMGPFLYTSAETSAKIFTTMETNFQRERKSSASNSPSKKATPPKPSSPAVGQKRTFADSTGSGTKDDAGVFTLVPRAKRQKTEDDAVMLVPVRKKPKPSQ